MSGATTHQAGESATRERLRALIPGATLQLIADAGHLVQLDAPAELAVAIAGWLAGQRSGSAAGGGSPIAFG